jgi:type III secretion system low calcium response chaperone LcrH/SycD
MIQKQRKKTDISLNKINLKDKDVVERLSLYIIKKMEENPGMTLKDATGISDETMEGLYSLAYSFYNQGKYREALALFELLAGTSPTVHKYFLGLGACYQQTEAYGAAFASYYIALNLDPDNPIPAYHAVDCLLKQDLKEEALECAEAAVLICDGRPEYRELEKRCQLIINSLSLKK